jgi:hypothetical protein
MKIRVERSGGIAGISISNEMDAKDLPLDLLRAAKKVVEDRKVSSSSIKSYQKGSADHFTYRISVDDGKNESVVECNQYNIEDDLRSLVKYIEKNSKRKMN